MNDVTHYSRGALTTWCRSKHAGNRVSLRLSRVDCPDCLILLESLLERFANDSWADKVGMFCVCTVSIGSKPPFRYMGRLARVDDEARLLHFESRDGTLKILDRSAIVEVDARPFNAPPRDQSRLPRFGF